MGGLIMLILGAAVLAGSIVPVLAAGADLRVFPVILGMVLLIAGMSRCRKQQGLYGGEALADRIGNGKVRDQEKLKKLALEYPDPKVRAAAAGQLTDQEALKEAALSGDSGVFGAALDRITDQGFFMQIIQGSYSASDKAKALKKVTDPDALAELAPYISARNDLNLSRTWLQAASEAAGKDPELLLKVSAAAGEIIRNSHADGSVPTKGRHDDAWQRVPHVSSDCHEDNTVWTQKKGPWGEWGYHADQSLPGSLTHQDSCALSEWEKAFSAPVKRPRKAGKT